LTGIETVREFQMLTATFSAQYGRALGGVFNAITKSGANEWHGSAYEFLRNSALDARNYFDRQDSSSGPRLPPFRRNHFGATLGGPVFRDKTFFFVAYEGLRESLTQTGIANVPDLNARRGILPNRTVEVSPLIAPVLRLFPEPSPGERNFGDGTAQYIFQAKQPTKEDFGQGRIDYQLSDSDSLFGRFTANNAERHSYRLYPDRFEVGTIETRLLTLSETRILSPLLLNTGRFSFNRVVPGTNHLLPQTEPYLIPIPGQSDPPGIEPGSGISPLTGTEGPGNFFLTNRFALNDDLNLTLGSHSLQFGGMFERLQYNLYFPSRPYGEWRFSNLENFLRAVPDRYRGAPPGLGKNRRGFRQWFMAMYLQDDWRVTPNLTLNLGVRWEPYTVPTEVNGYIDNLRNLMDVSPAIGNPYWKNQSWRNFSPRFGFAWSPFQSGKTSLRGGFGLFYVPVDSAIFSPAVTRGSGLSPIPNINNPARFPDALAAIAASQTAPGSANIFAMLYGNLRSPHALQISLSAQQQIGESNVVTLGFSSRRGLNLPSFSNYNMPLFRFNGVALEMPEGANRFNPEYRLINYVSTNANAWYNGLTFSLQRRFSAGLQWQIAYTYSRTISEGDGAEGGHVSAGSNNNVNYPHDLRVARGLSGYHLKNSLTFSYSYDLPFGQGAGGLAGHLISGWQLTGIVALRNGQPFTPNAVAPRALADHLSTVMPNVVPGFTHDQIITGSPDGYFILDGFAPPGARELGNLGRNSLIGPGTAQMDFGLTKNNALSERVRLQFRAEAFNLLNRANFASPAQFGNSAGNLEVFNRDGQPIPSSTVIVGTATTSRQVQLGLKLIF
jgi:outer membrane receptor protein involved in Fe transport